MPRDCGSLGARFQPEFATCTAIEFHASYHDVPHQHCAITINETHTRQLLSQWEERVVDPQELPLQLRLLHNVQRGQQIFQSD
jgi:hypothetical protein